MTVYKIRTQVKDLEHKRKTLRRSANRTDPEKPVFTWEYEDVGWFVQFEGSYEALFVGKERPEDLEVGAPVEILIRPLK